VIGTANVVNEAIDCGCEKIVTLGSSAEYGNKIEKTDENMILTPVDVYGSTKAAATIIAHQIASKKHGAIVTLRPFGVFGEGEDKHKIFCHIILRLLQNKDVDLTLCEPYRDYCYVENIIDGLLLAAQTQFVQNEIFNIGSGEAFPLKYFVELIFFHFHTGRKPKYGVLPYRDNERWHVQMDIAKIKSVLHWEPRISLEDGMIRTIHWFKQNKGLYFNE
jgi:nucleoside-diphosphate-sugar epimerase